MAVRSLPPAPAEAPVPPPPRWRGARDGDRLLLWAGLAVLVVPLVVAAIALLADAPYRPRSDDAGIELRTRDVGVHPVRLGLWSRSDWNHPGPALFYLLALPYRLGGEASVALNVGALLINGAALVGIALIARRRGGTPLFLLTVGGLVLLCWGLTSDFVSSFWNPFIPVLPFGLLLFLCWSMACGDRWALPVAAGVTTFCVQTHVGYVVLAVPLLLLGAGWLAGPALLAATRGRPGWRQQLRPLLRPALVTATLLAVSWLPPVIEELQHRPGNLANIREYFTGTDEERGTLDDGWHVVGGQFTLGPSWLEQARPLQLWSSEPELLRSAAPVLLPLVLAAAVVLWRRRPAGARALLVFYATAAVLGVLSVARTYRPVADYRLRWASIVGMLGFLLVAWAACELLRPAWRRWRRAAGRWPLALAAVALLLGGARNAADAADLIAHRLPEIDSLVPAIEAAVPPGDGAVVFRPRDSRARVAQGVFLAMERDGFDMRTPDEHGIFGSGSPHRVWKGGEPVRATVVVALAEPADELLLHPGRLPLVAYHGEPDLDERRDRLRRLEALEERHEEGEISDVERFVAARELLEGMEPAVAAFVAAGDVPVP